jgi:hypothetical protein
MTKLSHCAVPTWLALLPAGVVLASWADWMPPSFALFGRAGPYWAGALTLAGLIIAWLRGALRPWRALASDSTLRALALGAAATVASWALASVGAVDQKGALFETGRIAIVLVFFLACSTLAARDQRTGKFLAWAALGLIAMQVALLLSGLGSEQVGAIVFEHAERHTHSGALPRFRGLAVHPMACGSSTLLLAGLLVWLPHRALRWVAIAAVVTVVMATLSFATLVLPLAAALMLPLRRSLRVAIAVLLGVAAVLALWTNPLRAEVAGGAVLERAPVPGYFQQDLGPRQLPIHTLTLPGLRLQYHLTGYAMLAARSVSCLREHPLGVGARNFVHSCPVLTMNTVGAWASKRSAHSAYGALIAEGGLLASIATIGLALLVSLRFRTRPAAELGFAVLLAYLLAGVGGASPYQFTFAALVATTLRAR